MKFYKLEVRVMPTEQTKKFSELEWKRIKEKAEKQIKLYIQAFKCLPTQEISFVDQILGIYQYHVMQIIIDPEMNVVYCSLYFQS